MPYACANWEQEKPKTRKTARKTTSKKETAAKADRQVSGTADIAPASQREERGVKYWLMKAEPESRIVNGKVRSQLALLTVRMSNSALMIWKN